jgi:hypothetical protein
MDSAVNYTIMDGNNLAKTVEEQLVKLKAENFNEEDLTALKVSITDLIAREKEQELAVNFTETKVAAKDKVFDVTIATIKRMREAARGGFAKEPKKLKQFRTDETISKGAATLSSTCEYLAPIAEAEIAVLSKNGFNQADLVILKGAPEQVKTAASDSRRALKQQKAATIIRNDAADEVTRLAKKIRRFVKARFAEKPEVMVLFEPLPKGKGGGGSEEEAGDNPNVAVTQPTPSK